MTPTTLEINYSTVARGKVIEVTINVHQDPDFQEDSEQKVSDKQQMVTLSQLVHQVGDLINQSAQ